METLKVPHRVVKNGEVLFEAMSHDDCFKWILDHQGQSVTYATKYGGYKIEQY